MSHKTIKENLKKLAFVVVGIFVLCTAANADYMSINAGCDNNLIGAGGGKVTNSDGTTDLAVDSVLQYIYAGPDNTIDPPASDGSVTDDDVLIKTTAVGDDSVYLVFTDQAGVFYHSATKTYASGTPKVYVRAWNATSIGSATHYGNSALLDPATGTNPPIPNEVGIAGFSTNTPKPGPQATITRSPSSFNLSVTEGQDHADRTFTVGNSGSATLNYSITDNVTWLSVNPNSGSIASGGGDDTITINFSTAALSAGTHNATITISDPSASNSPQTIAVTMNVGGIPPTDPDITSITPEAAEIGQTLVIDGANFGASQGTSVVRFGTTMGNPTSWSDDQIIVAVPSTGISTGDVVVTVDVDGTTDTANITIAGEKLYVDDFEGGAVNCFSPTENSLYYVFEDVEDITPVDADINDDLRSTEEAYEREYGAKVRYSFVGTDGSDYGGGWGAKLANALDLDATYAVDIFIKWDGTSNYITLNFKDGDGTANATDISNTILAALGSEGGVVRLYKSNFSVDEAGSDAGDDDNFDWTDVVGYNLVYKGEATTTEYHYLDALSAIMGTTGGPEINTIIPAAGPAGTQITVSGIGFGDNQSMSMLMFENTDTGASYQAEVISWREDQIVAIVPRLADKGAYEVRVIKIAIVAGTTTAQESDPADFTVTARGATEGGLATIYPNPFNPIAEQTGQPNASAIKAVTIAYDPGSATNIGVYIYDMTGRRVYKQVTADTQVSWNGYDTHGNVVGDGAYILRVVDEDSKRVIAKGKILVIKQ